MIIYMITTSLYELGHQTFSLEIIMNKFDIIKKDISHWGNAHRMNMLAGDVRIDVREVTKFHLIKCFDVCVW